MPSLPRLWDIRARGFWNQPEKPWRFQLGNFTKRGLESFEPGKPRLPCLLGQCQHQFRAADGCPIELKLGIERCRYLDLSPGSCNEIVGIRLGGKQPSGYCATDRKLRAA